MSEDNVVTFTGQTKADISIPQMVENIKWEELDDVIILAGDKEGNLRAYASKADSAVMIYMLEKFKISLLTGVYG